MKKRILSAILVLCMVIVLLPVTAGAATTNYDLWVGGVQVTSDNASNITGAGISVDTGGSVSYNASTKTLNLNNATITGAHEHWAAMSAIYGETDLTIHLTGNNTITGTQNSTSSYGIYIDDKWNTSNTGKLTFTGTGSLTVSASDAPSYWSVAVFANDTITVGDNCSITAYCSNTANTIHAFYSYAHSNKYVLPNVSGILVAGNKTAPEATNFEVCNNSPDAFKYLRIAPGYTVTLNANGGTVNTSNVTCYFVDSGVTLPTNVTKNGCEFAGWFDNAELTGEAVTAIPANTTGDKAYWAKWAENAPTTYTVSFDANGGNGTMNDVTVNKGADYTIPDCGFTAPEGKVFDIWKDASGTRYRPGSTTMLTSNLTLYAQWEDIPPAIIAQPTASNDYTVTTNYTDKASYQWYEYGTGDFAVVSGEAADLEIAAESTARVSYADGKWNYAWPSSDPYAQYGHFQLDIKDKDIITVQFDSAFSGTLHCYNDTSNDSFKYNASADNKTYICNVNFTDADQPNALYIYPAETSGDTSFTITITRANTATEPVNGQTTNSLTDGEDGKQYACQVTWNLEYAPGYFYETSLLSNPVTYVAPSTPAPSTPTVTFDANGGSGSMAPATGSSSGHFTIPSCTFTAPDGKMFAGWKEAGTNTLRNPGDAIALSADMTLIAQWKDISNDGADGGPGAVGPEPDPEPILPIIPIIPEAPHACESVCPVCGLCTDDRCRESVCRAKCAANEMDYSDVHERDWFYEAVQFVHHERLMDGIGNGIFDVEGELNRAMMATILWRMEGCPTVDSLMSFTDVPADEWYTEAVRWAAATGIVTGHSDNSFRPMDKLTREQMAAMLWRYAKTQGWNTSGSGWIDPITSKYAVPAMQWAVSSGMLDGTAPQQNALRAEIAYALMKLLK